MGLSKPDSALAEKYGVPVVAIDYVGVWSPRRKAYVAVPGMGQKTKEYTYEP